jgi:hypothetical protein
MKKSIHMYRQFTRAMGYEIPTNEIGYGRLTDISAVFSGDDILVMLTIEDGSVQYVELDDVAILPLVGDYITFDLAGEALPMWVAPVELVRLPLPHELKAMQCIVH